MTKPPPILKIGAYILLAIVVAYPLQIMFLYGHTIIEINYVMAKLSILNWLVMLGAGFSAYLFFQASPWIRLVLPVLTLLVAWNNFIVGFVGFDYNEHQTVLATVGFASFNLMFMIPSVQFALAHPEKRWWLSPKRFCVSVPVFVSPSRGEGFYTNTFDLSSSGAFLRAGEELAEHCTGESLSLKFTFGTFRSLRCNARIVRNTDAKGKYPKGYGLEFTDLSRKEQKTLSKYLGDVAPVLRQGVAV